MIMNKLKLRLCVSMVLAVLRTRVDAQYDKDRRVLEPHPEYPGKCYDDVTRAAYVVGETWGQTGVCVQYKCSQDKGKFLISTFGCIDTSAFENDVHCWIMEGDIASSYPSCCPVVVCA